jgi:hypothetical protein
VFEAPTAPLVRSEVTKVRENSKANRSSRLRSEANNWLIIAVHKKTAHIAGQLIDEAARLMRRSAELAQPTEAMTSATHDDRARYDTTHGTLEVGGRG